MRWDKIDRRRFVRIKFPFTIHIYFPEEPPISAYTENISTGGIKVTVRQELRISSLVNLEIYLKLRSIDCKGKIIWANRRESAYLEGEYFYDTGMELQDLKPEDKEAIKERLEKVMAERKEKEKTNFQNPHLKERLGQRYWKS